jgi:hypothetical protein
MTAKTKIAALLAALMLCSVTASAETQSPGTIATASRVLAARQANCRAQAKEQKPGYFKRRAFVRACMKT